jgi:hypothetical protein
LISLFEKVFRTTFHHTATGRNSPGFAFCCGWKELDSDFDSAEHMVIHKFTVSKPGEPSENRHQVKFSFVPSHPAVVEFG